MKFLLDTVIVLISNVIMIISGIVVGFILPKILSVNDYGYYKTFTLYVTYLGLFSVGFVDGIVLKYGGFNYEQLEKCRFRKYYRYYIFIQAIWTFLICTISFLIKSAHLKQLLLFLAINLLFLNTIGYFRQISEITQRFREYTIIKLANSFLTIASVIVMCLLKPSVRINANIFIVITLLINAIISIWYLAIYRGIVFGSAKTPEVSFKDVVNLCKLGFPLMIANLCSTLILTIDRQFVNVLFDNETYAVYAFAYNLLSLLTVATTAASTVLYPYLKRSDKESMAQNYEKYVVLLSIMVFLAIACYFPLQIIIRRFLPQYEKALPIFRVVLPGLPLTSSITVIMHNYYKTAGKSNLYFRRSFIILIVSLLANIIAYALFKSPVSISVASIVVIVVWYLYIDSYFSSIYTYDRKKILVYLLLAAFGFYVSTSLTSVVLSGVIYIAFYALITMLFWHSIIKSTWIKSNKT